MNPAERLKGIEAFVATADAGSFAKAGERLHLTGSAVGKSVARLEERLGARLFERTTRRLALTDAGRSFHRTCAAVLGELEEAGHALATQQQSPAGRVRLDVPVTFGAARVMPLLLPALADYPLLRPEVSFTDRFVDLAESSIDLAVRIGGETAHAPGLGQRELGRERLVFCAAPSYLSRRGRPTTLDDLQRHDCICYGGADGRVGPWRFAAPGRPGEPGAVELRAVEARLVIGHGQAQAQAVAAGYGVAQLATWLIADELASGRLVELLPEAAAEGLPLSLVWLRSREALSKVAVLVELLGAGLRID